MRWTDLDSHDLFDWWSGTPGIHRIIGARALVIDAATLALITPLLADAASERRAPQLLRDLGYAQGMRTAERALATIPDRVDSWELASVCGKWLGLGQAAGASTPTYPAPLSWQHSFEAAIERATDGTQTAPVCHFLAGFLSGCVSRALDRTVTCVEDHCVVQGHPYCRFVAAEGLPAGADAWARQIQTLIRTMDSDQTESVVATETSDDDLGLGARSPHMREIVSLAARVAPVDSTVLITGETGVGKERLAEFIHQHSTRAGQPYLPLNCSALSDALLESELFGHRRGSFTGATEDHAGLFEAAHGGTIFLDEIGDISTAMQVKLLRVLQERKVRRLGETHYRAINVRVIAATNRNLQREVQEGRFRQDLYYRLNVVALHVPPLRDRPEDLRLLLRTVLLRTARALARPIHGYTPQALDALLTHSWPGNIRELENAIERACAVAVGSLIDLADLPEGVRHYPPSTTPSHLAKPLRDVEREYILAALRATGGHKARAAERLQISRQTLTRKLREYGLTSASGRNAPGAQRGGK
jgi:two-component system, NtrC family, response regulator HydG